MTGPATVPGRDLNPGPLSLEESALLTELTGPDERGIIILTRIVFIGNFNNIITKAYVKLEVEEETIYNTNIGEACTIIT